MSRNLSVLDALVSSHTTSGLPHKTRSNLYVEEAFFQAASSVAGLSCQAAHRLSYVVVTWSG